MHRLHEHISSDEVNRYTEAGAFVVHMYPSLNGGGWDVVLDHPDHSEQQEAVLSFLQSVNAAALDEAMAKAHRLSESPGTVALRTLMDLAGGGGERT